ncbi:alkene reductase [Phenylobacterium immobile]|uniref:alkene reductase n=1 Tax=Phenylobacterium immobile TaxID=21 RepID=UPI000A3E180E|nr:alkene reductase [Phenylobacterium immobile]
MPTLLDPLELGGLTLKNRLVMAPLTRIRCGSERSPGPMVVEYYRQRASAGLILTEATSIVPQGVGYPNTPGIWSAQQVEGWKRVTEAVHAAGGVIFLQLWHVGRISDPSFLDGDTPVSASAIAPRGEVSLLRPKRPYVTPHPLAVAEIADLVEAYRKGAENAQRAGFDGVELHGANGYLLDQFLQDGTNRRTDDYGGSVENRARFMLEAVDAAISVFGAGRVGLHISPRGEAHDMSDSNPAQTFGYVAEAAQARNLGFLFVRERAGPGAIGDQLRALYKGVYIANDGFDLAAGEAAVASGAADAVSFGKLFIANPDLPARYATGAHLNPPRPETFYGDGPEGYIDYPALSAAD